MLVMRQEYEAPIAQITQILTGTNLQVVRTFDLKSACTAQPGGICPHHGTAPCNCQLSVLLVYGQADGPVTLTIRQCDGQTSLRIADSPQGQVDPQFVAAIRQVIALGKLDIEP